jgi:hypothetical protein
MICRNCGAETDVQLIDTTLIGEARRRLRFCGSCRPEAQHPYAGCLPRVIAASSLSNEEKQKALAARRYTPDYRAVYSIAERVIDLAGPVVGGSS